jgi:RNA polymerase sigma-70 factor (ECF subfamily)
MAGDTTDISALLLRASVGDEAALRESFARYRDRLKLMVALRLSRRLQGRINESDVVQESYQEVARRFKEYVSDPRHPFFLWLRQLTGLKLAEIHRRYLGAQMRDTDCELSLHRGGLPAANSLTLAAQLLGKVPKLSDAAILAETRLRVQEALNNLDAIDREVLALRHFEQLSMSETAEVLGLSKAAAGSCYLRAIKRLRQVMLDVPGSEIG